MTPEQRRENLKRDLDILHTVNHKKGERPDLHGEMNLIDLYTDALLTEARINELEQLGDGELVSGTNTFVKFIPTNVYNLRIAELKGEIS